MKSLSVLLIAGLLLPAAAPRAAADPKPRPLHFGDPARGAEIARRWCVACHRTGTRTADDQIPSFPALAAAPERTDAAVRAFLMRPHSPMPPLALSVQQIEDLVAYVGTFRPAAPPPGASSP